MFILSLYMNSFIFSIFVFKYNFCYVESFIYKFMMYSLFLYYILNILKIIISKKIYYVLIYIKKRQSLDCHYYMVAGAGLEPTTFGL